CDPGKGINAVLRKLMSPPVKLMVMGIACSIVSQPLSRVLDEWNLASLSGSSTSVELQDRTKYPRFFRTLGPDTAATQAKFSIMESFGWKKFATVHEPYALFSTVTDRMLAFASDVNFTVITSKILTSDVAMQVTQLKVSSIGPLTQSNRHNHNCVFQMYKQGHYGPHIILSTVNWLENDFTTNSHTTRCTEEEIVQVLQYALYLGPSLGNSDPSTVTVSGKTNEEYDRQFLHEFNGTWPYGSDYRTPVYDFMWAGLLALNSTMMKLQHRAWSHHIFLHFVGSEKTLEDFAYNDTEMTDMVIDSLYNDIRFRGLAGLIDFDEHGDTNLDIEIEQQQVVGYYREETRSIDWIDENQVPVDSVTMVYTQEHVSTSLYTAMSIWAILGVIQCAVFFAVNMIFRNKRLIKMSSPKINNLILLGCALCYLTTLFADLKANVISLRAVCTVRLCTFILGFSLAFGSLFAKTWRVHSILTTKTVKQMVIPDGKLVMMVMALMSINGLIIGSWQIYDPYHVHQKNFSSIKVSDITDDKVIVPQINSCISNNHVYFSGSLYVVQGITMIFGAFLAWETKKVKLQALNDSKLIGICIYNVAVLSILGGIILFIIEDDLDLSYGFSSGLIISGTMLTSNIIFVPKVCVNHC
ncbi:hypothetical protein CAPTEDRAFT_140881, partial [Capitella teleta]